MFLKSVCLIFNTFNPALLKGEKAENQVLFREGVTWFIYIITSIQTFQTVFSAFEISAYIYHVR